MARVIIAHSADGQQIVDKAVALLSPESQHFDIVFGRPELEPWEPVVVLYVLSAGSLSDPALLDYGRRMAAKDFPLVPVVEQVSTFRFDSIPEDLDFLRSRNAMGVDPGGSARFLESVHGYLGLESFLKRRQVFISYRRTDAEPVAQEIEGYLWTQRCVPFLDTVQLIGGDVVQPEVMKNLHEKDFILFLDSPDSKNSPWVRAEVLEAFAQRIPVCTVRLDSRQAYIDILRDRPSMVWDRHDEHNLERIMRLISRGIAGRDSLDDRIVRTLTTLAQLYELKMEPVAPRRFRMSRGTGSVLVEYEDSPITLERLHRLALWYSDPPPSRGAVFVSGDHELLTITSMAVTWGRGAQPLNVMPIAEVATELRQLLVEGT